ncbi:hypothetical protein [Halopenitus persicus]|uniref:Uncharacterized protein n=1 Tax=Halopenitus persicus TaxID=1048396 RepID=A0A1H3MRD6_9EURY|nr:hypothetical protein [Halopenitus persicus]SDY79262.1 hypothetical protein SAMN05216564_11056 [Halopenitus persicus]
MATRRSLIVIGVSLLALTALAATGASADHGSADEYLNQLNDLRDTEALTEYTELDLARSQAVVELQTTEEFDGEMDARMHHLLNAILAFQEAYATAQDDPVASVDHADEAQRHLDQLSEAGGETYAGLGTVALERFYATQAEVLYEQAQQAESTPRRLELLNASVRAFDGAGESERFADAQLERDQLLAEYESDMQRHDALVSDANAYLEGCGAACEGPTDYVLSGPFGAVSEYTAAMSAHGDASEAAAIAEEHGLSEDASGAAQLESRAFTAMVSAGAASAILAFLYAGLFVAVAAGVVWRISVWGSDVHTSALDEIVTPLEVDDA